MIGRILRISGLIVIILFCSYSVVAFKLEHYLKSTSFLENAQWLAEYPSFFEDRFYDIRMRSGLNPEAKSEKLVLAAIDDKSLQSFGSWPVDRKIYAKALNKLKTFGAKVVAFDVVFPEKEKFCLTEKGGERKSPDQIFSDAIGDFQKDGKGKVILAYSLTFPGFDEAAPETPEELYDFLVDSKEISEDLFQTFAVDRYTFPIKELLKFSPELSYIGAVPDADGIFRRYPIVAKLEDIYVPSYSLLTYRSLTGEDFSLTEFNSGTMELVYPKGLLELNFEGNSKIRWFGDSRNFPVISMVDIVKASDDDQNMKKLLQGKAIFIGSTAFAAHDLRHTPVDPKLPGVFYHMNLVQMLLDGKVFQSMENSIQWSWGILVIGTVIVILLSLLKNALLDAAFVSLYCIGLYLYDVRVLTPEGYQIALFFSLLCVFGCYFWNTLINFYYANKDKTFLKQAFGNYISPELIDEMYRSGTPPQLGGESGIRTAFFTDIQSFSTFSEKLTASQLVTLLNEYLTEMTDILLEEKGTLDKYEGDAIIAFFGAPMPVPDHAVRAARVAARMQSALLLLREKWISEGDKWPKIVHEMRMRIGINTGEIVTGNMGSVSRMNYTMMGDSVNLAARLEEAAKQYGIFTQVSQFTKKEVDSQITEEDPPFLWRELDTIRVVGKSEPVTTYELIGLKNELPIFLQNLVELFEKGLSAYKKQKWDSAKDFFTKSLELEYQRFPELKGVKTNPSEIYISRCEEFKASPPGDDWDGVYTLTSK